MPAAAGSRHTSRRIWLTAYAPLIIWTIVIVGLGTGAGAMNETSRIIRPLLEFLFPDAAPETLTLYHGYIRKFAHFAEYAVLGFLACRAFSRARFGYCIAVAVVAAVAATDEINQSFDPRRTGSIWDVLLDLFGALSAIAAYKLLHSRRPQAGPDGSSGL